MSLEQTNQLIQLVLNSVLMVAACVVILGGLLVRHTATQRQLRSLTQEYSELMGGSVLLRGDRLLQVKHQLRQLRQQYQDAYRSILVIHYALLTFVLSGLTVALRTIANADWLITAALVLFIVGLVILLLGLALALADLHAAKRSLWHEIQWVLNLNSPGETPLLESKPEISGKRSPRPKKPTRRLPKLTRPSRPNPKTGVI
jgi:protein-S-isoprenylcysteine O-methyltransferase Ste14